MYKKLDLLDELHSTISDNTKALTISKPLSTTKEALLAAEKQGDASPSLAEIQKLHDKLMKRGDGSNRKRALRRRKINAAGVFQEALNSQFAVPNYSRSSSELK